LCFKLIDFPFEPSTNRISAFSMTISLDLSFFPDAERVSIDGAKNRAAKMKE
jgi:hypothetical protein